VKYLALPKFPNIIEMFGMGYRSGIVLSFAPLSDCKNIRYAVFAMPKFGGRELPNQFVLYHR